MLLGVLGALAPAPAQAQTTCTPDTSAGEFWCGVVTVGEILNFGVPTSDGFFEAQGAGDLSDEDFEFRGNSYTIEGIYVSRIPPTSAGYLSFWLDRVLSAEERAVLVLRIGSDEYAFSDATIAAGVPDLYSWDAGLDWSSETEVTLRLADIGPGAPASFTATPGDGQVELSWTAPTSGVTRHDYRYRTSGAYPATWTLIANSGVGGANEDGFAVTGLTNETAYTFQLRAVQVKNSSTTLTGAAAEAGPVTPRDPSAIGPPGKPTDLTATPSGNTQINLSWTAPADNGGSPITGYKIEVSTDGGTNWDDLVGDTGNDDSAYSHTGLSPGDTRHYRVSAINSAGTSDPSDIASATIETCTLNTGDIWCGVMTVGAQVQPNGSTSYGFTAFYGELSDNDGDRSFTYGTNTYTIGSVFREGGDGDGVLVVLLSSHLAEADRAKLVLHIGSASFAFSDADVSTDDNSSDENSLWGSDLDWSNLDYVTLRLREAAATTPTITAVAVTSTPLLTSGGVSPPDTYGAGEDIEFSVTYSEAVEVTGDPQFGFSLAGARLADYDADSVSPTLRFVYTVQPADRDDDGIWVGNHATGNVTLQLDSDDAITSTGGADANLEHDRLGALSDHKVDGSRSAEDPEEPVVTLHLSDADGVAGLGDRLHGDGVGECGGPGDGRRLRAEREPGAELCRERDREHRDGDHRAGRRWRPRAEPDGDGVRLGVH